MILLDIEGLGASVPDRVLFSDLDLTVRRGDRIGIVGMNGAGKSTLLGLVNGDIAPQQGVIRRGRGVRIGSLPQNPVLGPGTVGDVVGGDWRGAAALDRLGMGGQMSLPTSHASGGQITRVALAALAAQDLDLMILDEPTNHLDLDAVEWLTQWLNQFDGGLVLVTHDRHLLDRVTNRIVEIDAGSAHHHVARSEHGFSGYSAYLAGRAQRQRQDEVAEHTRRAMAKAELAWLRRGAPARTSKPKAHVERALARQERADPSVTTRSPLDLDMGMTRLGSQGIELAEVSYRFESDPDAHHPWILDRVTHRFEPGNRVGLVGPNGAGKTTLLDIIAGERSPTLGEVRVGATVRMSRYRQHADEFDPAQRVRDVITGGPNDPTGEQLELMKRFWFDRAMQFAPVGTLSGGERRRLQLLITLAAQPNVMLLDEPTNDLDLDTLRALEDFLDSWAGIVIVVSHDRTLLDRTVDELIVLDGSGSLQRHRGGVAAWLASRARTDSGDMTSSSRPPKIASDRERPRSSDSGDDRPRRSPSTLRRLLAECARDIARHQHERADLEARLSSTGDHDDLAAIARRLGEVQSDLDEAENRWLEYASEAESRGLGIASDLA